MTVRTTIHRLPVRGTRRAVLAGAVLLALLAPGALPARALGPSDAAAGPGAPASLSSVPCEPAGTTGTDAGRVELADPLAAALYRPPGLAFAGTDCTGAFVRAAGYPTASVGTGACLADDDRAVQGTPGPFPCPAVATRRTAATGAFDPDAAVTRVTVDTESQRDEAATGPVDTQATGTALQQYRVEAPAGAEVAAEVQVRASAALEAALAGDPNGDAAQATATSDLQGTVTVSRMVPDPSCAPDEACDPVVASVADAAWSVHDTTEHCRACVRVVDGVASRRPDHRRTERARRATVGDADGTTRELLDPGDARGDGVGVVEVDPDVSSDWSTPAVTVPLTLRAGDVVTQELRLALDTAVTGRAGDAAAALGTETLIVVPDGSARLVPLQSLATPDLPTVDVGDVDVAEPASGTATVEVPLTLSMPSADDVTVRVRTAPRSARPGDFDAVDRVVTIPAGQVRASVPVEVRSDDVDEDDEALAVELSDPQGARPGRTTALVRISDQDPTPRLALSPVQTVWEDDEQAHTARVTARLSAPAAYDVTLAWDVQTGTAGTADLGTATGTATVPAGEVFANIDVAVLPDTASEQTESFTVRVTSVDAQGHPVATPADPATVRILDARGLDGLSLVGPTVAEGDTRSAIAWVSATVARPYAEPVPFQYSVVADTADGDDVTLVEATGTMPAGRTQVLLPTWVGGDLRPEGDERFRVTVGSVADGGPWVQDSATVGIADDEDLPTVSVEDAEITEAHGREATLDVGVVLSRPSDQDVTVDVTARPDTAVDDFAPFRRTVTIPAGRTRGAVRVQVYPDTWDERDEVFFLDLSEARFARLGRSRGAVTIHDDDPSPALLLPEEVTVFEDDQQVRHARVPVWLARPVAYPVPFTWETVAGTASEADFVATSATKVIPTGSTGVVLDVPVKADSVPEALEELGVRIRAVGAGLPALGVPAEAARVRIRDAAELTGLAVSATRLREPDAGTGATDLGFTVPAPVSRDVSVAWELRDASAKAPSDYVAARGTAVIPAGRTEVQVPLRVRGDEVPEGVESFDLVVTDAGGLPTTESTRSVFLVDGDRVRLDVSDALVVESSLESRAARVTVSLSTPLSRDATFTWRTAPTHGATPDVDYRARSGRAVIRAGALNTTVIVPVLPDDETEDWESFAVEVTGVDDAQVRIADGSGHVLIDRPASADAGVHLEGTNITEGDSGIRLAWMTVNLPDARDADTVVTYRTTDLAATAGADYTGVTNGRVVVPAGAASVGIPVRVLGDRTGEAAWEDVLVEITGAGGVPVTHGAAVLVIRDDDAA